MFQLTAEEKSEVVTNCDHLAKLRFSPVLPNVFTEHGAVMLASLLKSKRAIEVSVIVVRAFVRMRRILSDQRQFALKPAEIGSKFAAHDQSIEIVFNAIRQLMEKPEPEPVRKIGFQVREPFVAPYRAPRCRR